MSAEQQQLKSTMCHIFVVTVVTNMLFSEKLRNSMNDLDFSIRKQNELAEENQLLMQRKLDLEKVVLLSLLYLYTF